METKLARAQLMLGVLKWVQVAITISIGVFAVQTGVDPWFTVFAVVLGSIFPIWAHATQKGLGERRYWAWVSGIAFFGLYLGTLLLPAAVYGLAQLLHRDVRQAIA